jgi:[ribosomal protein S18]-alanine N-acetyltransferase
VSEAAARLDCLIRPGEPGDLPEIAAIQAASPQAANWPPESYLEYGLSVADADGRVAGFLAWRTVAEGEFEILNLAVEPGFRRRGVGRALLLSLQKRLSGVVYLELRASNEAARCLYKSLCFQEVGSRPGYYDNPPEAAIVMKLHSC